MQWSSTLVWINMEIVESALLGWKECGVLEIETMEGVQLLVMRGSKAAMDTILGWE